MSVSHEPIPYAELGENDSDGRTKHFSDMFLALALTGLPWRILAGRVHHCDGETPVRQSNRRGASRHSATRNQYVDH